MPDRSRAPEEMQELAHRLRQWAEESNSPSYTAKLKEAAELIDGVANSADRAAKRGARQAK